MRLSKLALLGGVAALALGVSTIGVTKQAEAFTDVEWEWDLQINEVVNKNVTIDVTVDPVGDVTDQILQIHLGNLEAESYVNGVTNYPIRDMELVPVEGFKKIYDKSVDLEASLTIEASQDDNSSEPGFVDLEIETKEESLSFFAEGTIVPLAGTIGGEYELDLKEYELEATLHADLDADLEFSYELESEEFLEISRFRYVSLNALNELPEVASAATAAGNVISVTSDTMVQEHSLQITADTLFDNRDYEGPPIGGEFEVEAEFELSLNEEDVDSENLFHNLAIVGGLAAASGLLDKAEIEAESEVYNIYNATVDSSATALGNLKSITLNTDLDQNAVVLADISQLSVADISASSKVGSGEGLVRCLGIGCQISSDGVTIYGYHNIGKLDKPIVNSVASAIGNAVNITVNSGQFTPPVAP